MLKSDFKMNHSDNPIPVYRLTRFHFHCIRIRNQNCHFCF